MSFFSRPITIAASLAPAARPAPGRWIDPRAQRFGAATSAATLAIAGLLGTWPVAAGVGLFLTISAAYGTRWFVFSRPWPLVRRWLSFGASELEHEMPPRFAQALGGAFVGLGSLLLAFGGTPWGWLPVLAVIGLQVLLAVTGFCLGCRLFFLRWYVPDLFARLVGRGVRRETLIYVEPKG
ncbi:MAG TPA: DUF4395 domain-containing protein [Candidatus Limnocylindrales bacterium]|nr:DUF4395 domain-containing protein [Candidatus Limnocylindrales bacterium]